MPVVPNAFAAKLLLRVAAQGLVIGVAAASVVIAIHRCAEKRAKEKTHAA